MDYSRLDAIHWWDRQKIRDATVMVAGVGAIGNEIVKLLGLIGIGRAFLVDRDTVEASNLTRSVLFRSDDVGKLKVEVAAQKLRQLNSETRVATYAADIMTLGMGAFRRCDLVFCCFDGYLPRFHLNHVLQHIGTPWVDGGMNANIELNGQIASYQPSADGPCYECNKSKKARAEYYDLNAQLNRWSCAISEHGAAEAGFIPSTPMMASIIAGLQMTEGLRYLVKNDRLPPQPGVIQFIETGSPRFVARPIKRNPNCSVHPEYPITEVVELVDVSADRTTVGGLLDILADSFANPQIELFYDLLHTARCENCGEDYAIGLPLLVFARKDCKRASCPKCGLRLAGTEFSALINRRSLCVEKTLADAGFRPGDIFKVSDAENPLAFQYAELTGDIDRLLSFS
jgi:adenylyltransferase/sulfurtransferase